MADSVNGFFVTVWSSWFRVEPLRAGGYHAHIFLFCWFLMPQHSKTQLDLQNSAEDNGQDGGLALDTAKPELKRPSMYAVVMLNDEDRKSTRLNSSHVKISYA